MASLLADLQYSLRMLRRLPWLTAMAISMITLGVGATTTVYSLVHALIDKPLPFPNAARDVMIWQTDTKRGIDHDAVSPANFLDWRQRNHSFDAMAAWRTWFYNVRIGTRAEQVWGVRTSANFFDILGVQPAFGRAFLPDEEQAGREQVCVVSHSLSARLFAVPGTAVGNVIEVDGRPFRIIGVLAPSFSLFGGARPYDLWMPFVLEAGAVSRDDRSTIVFARRAEGVTLGTAQRDMNAIATQLAAEYPESQENRGALVADLHGDQTAGYRPTLTILMVAVMTVLAIACLNVGNLFLTKLAPRNREIATRRALGATTRNIARQLLIESVPIGVTGGVLGFLLANLGVRMLRTSASMNEFGLIPRIRSLAIDVRVTTFALAISVLTTVLFGVLPAFYASRVEIFEALKRLQFGGVPLGRRSQRALIIGEVGLSLALVVASGVLLHSLFALISADYGFDPRNVITMQVWLPETGYPGAMRVRQFYDDALAQIRALPQVSSASAINFLPLSGWGDSVSFSITGQAAEHGNEPSAQYRVVDPDYFRTMRIPLLRGRPFRQSDKEGAPVAVVLSETVARRFWPKGDALGSSLAIHFPESQAPWRPDRGPIPASVIGIVGDTRERVPTSRYSGELYLAYQQIPSRLMRLVVRTSAPGGIAERIAREVNRVGAAQPVTEVKTMDEISFESLRHRQFVGALLALFSAVSLALALIGLYGVISYSVTQRRWEIGLRIALGASRIRVISLFLVEGLRVTAIGVASGIVGTVVAIRLLTNAFFGIVRAPVLDVVAAAVLLFIAGVFAVLGPAVRASRIDPAVGLREL